MVHITLPDGSKKSFENPITPHEIALSISEGLARNTISAMVDGNQVETTTTIEKDSTVQLLTWNDDLGKKAFWHSSAHLLAQAILFYFPAAKLTIGPAIENGFYYDVDFGDEILSEKDFEKIEKKMLENANAVKRMEHQIFIINNEKSTVLRQHYAITILNEKGEEHARLVVFYDKLTSINSVYGKLYNAAGKQLKSIKTKDLNDYSAVSDNSLAEDGRVKTYDFNYKVYPYTVEYEIEVSKNNSFIFPGWTPQEGEFLSVEQSDYSVVFMESYQLKHKSLNYKGEPKKSLEKGKQNLTWSVVNLPAIKVPFATASWADLATVVYIAPTSFEIAGYKGNMDSWKSYGEFLSQLNKDKDVLPANIAMEVNNLTAGVTDVKERIKILYNYLQKNTRYISVQLGIGGWQPFDASYVAKNGYGDCKALTNYMHSLLKAANIPSYYTVIYAGTSGFAKNRFMQDLPSTQFNHVVLLVPTGKDSLWLECTSQQSPAGYMGEFTGNRKAVSVTEAGGVVVSTPQYGVNENQQLRSIKGKLSAEGNLNMIVETRYECFQQENLSQRINTLSEQKLKEYLEKSLTLSTYDINKFSYKETKSALPFIEESLDITVPNFASISGKRIFITPNILNRSGNQLTYDSLRKSDFVFNYPYRDKDEISIEIPEGYEIEAKPKDRKLETPFGKYILTTKLVDNKVIYSRLMEQSAGRFSPKLQKDIVDFFKEVYSADRSRIVLVKKES